MSSPKKILVIDVEATCWKDRPSNPQRQFNEIIEIGVASIDIKTKTIETTPLSIMVKNSLTEISDFCTELTTIDQAMIDRDGVDFKYACDEVLKKFLKSDRNIFASWGDYDRTAFERNCQLKKVEYPFQKNMHLNVKTLFVAKYGYNGGQASCGTDLGIKMEGTAHRGVDDAINIAKILQKLL